jgi:hypothetical protein
MAAHHDDWKRYAAPDELVEHLQPVHSRHLQVDQSAAAAEPRLAEEFAAPGIDPGRIAVSGEQIAGGSTDDAVVVDDMDDGR